MSKSQKNTTEAPTVQEPIKPTLIDKNMSIPTLEKISKTDNGQITIQGRNVQVQVSPLIARIISTFK